MNDLHWPVPSSVHWRKIINDHPDVCSCSWLEKEVPKENVPKIDQVCCVGRGAPT